MISTIDKESGVDEAMKQKINDQFNELINDERAMGFMRAVYQMGICDAMMTLESPPDARLYPGDRLEVMFQNAMARIKVDFESELNSRS